MITTPYNCDAPLVSVDSETELFGYANMAPRAACYSFAWFDTDGSDKTMLADAEEGAEEFIRLLKEAIAGRLVLALQNAPYDFGVLLRQRPDAWPYVIDALEAGGIHDTMTAEWLLDTARGLLRQEWNEEKECYVSSKSYALEAMAITYLHWPRYKDEWRLRYGELIGVPLDQWPEPAVIYPQRDASATLQIAALQRQVAASIHPHDPLVADLAAQCRAYFALHLCSAWGMELDPVKVSVLSNHLQEYCAELEPELIKSGLLYKQVKGKAKGKISRKMEPLFARITADCIARGVEIPFTAGGVDGTNKKVKVSADIVSDCTDPVLQLFASWLDANKLLQFTANMLAIGRGPIHPRYGFADTGRTTCSGGKKTGAGLKALNIQQLPRGLPKAFIAWFKERYGYEPAGVRECIVSREGTAMSSTDYSALELCTFAQVLTELVGPNDLADALNNGIDPHTKVAAQLMGIDYDSALALIHAKDPRAKEMRQVSKCFHPETEALTPSGWKKIGDLTPEDTVAQAWPERGGKAYLEWVKPTAVFQRPCTEGELIHMHNESIDLRTTADHRMLGFDVADQPYICQPEELPTARFWLNAGELTFGDHDPDEITLRLAVATQADGSIQHQQNAKKIRFGFTKKRKADRLRKLLTGLPFTETSRPVNGKRGYWFVLSGNVARNVTRLLDTDKTMPWRWLGYTATARALILEEAAFWDSHVIKGGRSYSFCTTLPKNAEVLQALAATTGQKSRSKKVKDAEGVHAAVYLLSIKDRAYARGGALKTKRENYTGSVVCLSVPSSFVLVRANGVPVITGQCVNFGFPGGMGAKKFVTFAKGQDITIEESFAYKLKAEWMKAWPQVKRYFDLVGELVGEGDATLVQLVSKRLRGGCRFTDSCNGYFQSLAADGAKAALWNIIVECYDERKLSVLWGSRVVGFVHDEYLCEHPEGKAHEAATRVGQIAVATMREYCPDVAIKAEPALSRCWNKAAGDPVHDANGRLIPYEDREQKAAV